MEEISNIFHFDLIFEKLLMSMRHFFADQKNNILFYLTKLNLGVVPVQMNSFCFVLKPIGTQCYLGMNVRQMSSQHLAA